MAQELTSKKSTRCLNPFRSIKLEPDVIQDPRNKKGKRKTIEFKGVIVIRDLNVENDPPYIELLAKENDK